MLPRFTKRHQAKVILGNHSMLQVFDSRCQINFRCSLLSTKFKVIQMELFLAPFCRLQNWQDICEKKKKKKDKRLTKRDVTKAAHADFSCPRCVRSTWWIESRSGEQVCKLYNMGALQMGVSDLVIVDESFEFLHSQNSRSGCPMRTALKFTAIAAPE